MGHIVVDKDKLFYLLQGLTDEYQKGIVGSILAYESPHTGAPADFAKAVQLLQVWEDSNIDPKADPRHYNVGGFSGTGADHETGTRFVAILSILFLGNFHSARRSPGT